MTTSERQKKRKTDYGKFIHSLDVRKKNYDDNRPAFATLRRGLGFFPTLYAPMHQHVIPYIPKDAKGWDKFAYFFLAALYASYISPTADDPDMVSEEGKTEEASGTSKQKQNLGNHFAEVVKTTDSSDSAERYLNILLTAHPDDLHYKLRQALAYLKSRPESIEINWYQLLSDIVDWKSPDTRALVQDDWATAFYRQLYFNAERAK